MDAVADNLRHQRFIEQSFMATPRETVQKQEK